jgi:hypothetical protein
MFTEAHPLQGELVVNQWTSNPGLKPVSLKAIFHHTLIVRECSIRSNPTRHCRTGLQIVASLGGTGFSSLVLCGRGHGLWTHTDVVGTFIRPPPADSLPEKKFQTPSKFAGALVQIRNKSRPLGFAPSKIISPGMTALSEKTQVSFANLGHPPSKIIFSRFS